MIVGKKNKHWWILVSFCLGTGLCVTLGLHSSAFLEDRQLGLLTMKQCIDWMRELIQETVKIQIPQENSLIQLRISLNYMEL